MITEEKLNEIFQKYETKEFSFEDIVKQLKNILNELSKVASEGERERFIKIAVSLDQNLDCYKDAIGDAEMHIPGADDKFKNIEFILRKIISKTEFIILDNLKKQKDPLEPKFPTQKSKPAA